ncbi:mRNA capping enzyme, catalytic domain-containing protein [Gongronella butleri]|nr:mRNA capping enzyme, catalytic domain-containing protein [Gongronella butleri]
MSTHAGAPDLNIPESIAKRVDPTYSQTLQAQVKQLLSFQHGGFPGTRPVLFEQKHLTTLEYEDYFVCDRNLAARCLLFFTQSPKGHATFLLVGSHTWYYVPRLLFTSRSRDNEYLGDTLMDGELVMDDEIKQTWRFLIYDLMVINGVSIVQRSFNTRLGMLQQDVIHPFKTRLHGDPSTQPPITSVGLKRMERAYGFHVVVDQMSKAPDHPTNSIIWTPVKYPYVPGMCEKLLKWKPLEMISMHFRLNAKWSKEHKPMYTLEVLSNVTYKFYDHFQPDPDLAARWKEHLPDGRICECRYDPQWQVTIIEPGYAPTVRAGGWRFVRFCDDKLAADTEHSVKEAMQMIREGITKDLLMSHMDRIRKAWKAREKGLQPPPPKVGAGNTSANNSSSITSPVLPSPGIDSRQNSIDYSFKSRQNSVDFSAIKSRQNSVDNDAASTAMQQAAAASSIVATTTTTTSSTTTTVPAPVSAPSSSTPTTSSAPMAPAVAPIPASVPAPMTTTIENHKRPRSGSPSLSSSPISPTNEQIPPPIAADGSKDSSASPNSTSRKMSMTPPPSKAPIIDTNASIAGIAPGPPASAPVSSFGAAPSPSAAVERKRPRRTESMPTQLGHSNGDLKQNHTNQGMGPRAASSIHSLLTSSEEPVVAVKKKEEHTHPLHTSPPTSSSHSRSSTSSSSSMHQHAPPPANSQPATTSSPSSAQQSPHHASYPAPAPSSSSSSRMYQLSSLLHNQPQQPPQPPQQQQPQQQPRVPRVPKPPPPEPAFHYQHHTQQDAHRTSFINYSVDVEDRVFIQGQVGPASPLQSPHRASFQQYTPPNAPAPHAHPSRQQPMPPPPQQQQQPMPHHHPSHQPPHQSPHHPHHQPHHPHHQPQPQPQAPLQQQHQQQQQQHQQQQQQQHQQQQQQQHHQHQPHPHHQHHPHPHQHPQYQHHQPQPPFHPYAPIPHHHPHLPSHAAQHDPHPQHHHAQNHPKPAPLPLSPSASAHTLSPASQPASLPAQKSSSKTKLNFILN